jgi:hemerythrin-like metal-binding protein
MAGQFLWEDRYSLGDEKIDDQHKWMFNLANQLPKVSDKENVKIIVLELYKYIREHFSYEEKIMKSAEYPLFSEHKQLHDKVIKQLNAISSSSFKSDKDLYKFKKFLFDWLVEHIMHEDKKYSNFIKGKVEQI